MKKVWIIAILLSGSLAEACDICHLYTGIVPGDQQHHIGWIYRSRMHFGELKNKVIRVGGPKHFSPATREGTVYKEIFNVLELRMRYQISNKWRVSAGVPLVNNYRSIDVITRANVYGVGDAWLLGEREVFRFSIGTNNQNMHRLQLGAGVKLPTGNTNLRYHNTLLDLDMQPGSGSTDGLFSLGYLLRYKRWGINSSGSVRISIAEKTDYRYGNGLNGAWNAFCLFPLGEKSNFMPNVGINYEAARMDKEEESVIANSGGQIVFAGAGADFFIGSLQVGGNFQMPVFQSYNGQQIPNINRIILRVQYHFNKTDQTENL